MTHPRVGWQGQKRRGSLPAEPSAGHAAGPLGHSFPHPFDGDGTVSRSQRFSSIHSPSLILCRKCPRLLLKPCASTAKLSACGRTDTRLCHDTANCRETASSTSNPNGRCRSIFRKKIQTLEKCPAPENSVHPRSPVPSATAARTVVTSGTRRLGRLYSRELQARRNPRWKYRSSARYLSRNAARQSTAFVLQPPPRATQNEPESGPVGSRWGEFE